MAKQEREIADPKIRTIEEFETYYGLASSYTAPWHENIKRWRRLYDFDHYEKKALPFEERYPDPTPTNVVDLAVGILLAKPLEFEARGWQENMNSESEASRVEKFLTGAIYVNNERHEMDIPYESVLNIVRDGASVVYCVWDPVIAKSSMTSSPDGQQQMLSRLPLNLQVIDPMQIFLLPGGPKRFGHVFRVWEMSAHEVEMTWGKPIKSLTSFLSRRDLMREQVKVKDYWRISQKNVNGTIIDVVENGLMAHDEVIWPIREMEGYDDVPFTLGFFKPVDRDNPKGWHGIIRPLESTIQHLESAFNRRARQILVYSSLPIIGKTIPHRRIRLDPALGKLVTLGLEEGLEFPTWPGNAPDVENHIGFLRARLQQAGFTDVMFGEGASQISGFALSQLGDQNRIRLTQPVLHLEMMWASWARKALKLTTNFTGGKIPIRVYGNMKGQDFVEQLATNDLQNFMVKATIKPEFPNEKQRNHAMANQVRDLLSESTLLSRYLDIEQPDEERNKKLEDMALKHPVYIQFEVMQRLMRIAAEHSDPLVKTAAMMTIQQLQAGAMGGGPQGGGTGMGQAGRPGEPGTEQLTGLASPTGEETPQAGGEVPPGQAFGDILAAMGNEAPKLMGG